MQVEHIQVSVEDAQATTASRSVDAALDMLVDAIRENCEVDSLLHPALDIIERYDRENQTDLLRTLKVYLANERNHVRAAAELGLHRNSLAHRIRRIEELTGIDFNNVDERFFLELSLRLSART